MSRTFTAVRLEVRVWVLVLLITSLGGGLVHLKRCVYTASKSTHSIAVALCLSTLRILIRTIVFRVVVLPSLYPSLYFYKLHPRRRLLAWTTNTSTRNSPYNVLLLFPSGLPYAKGSPRILWFLHGR